MCDYVARTINIQSLSNFEVYLTFLGSSHLFQILALEFLLSILKSRVLGKNELHLHYSSKNKLYYIFNNF